MRRGLTFLSFHLGRSLSNHWYFTNVCWYDLTQELRLESGEVKVRERAFWIVNKGGAEIKQWAVHFSRVRRQNSSLMFHVTSAFLFTGSLHVLPSLVWGQQGQGCWTNHLIIVSPHPFQHKTLQELLGWGWRSGFIPSSFNRLSSYAQSISSWRDPEWTTLRKKIQSTVNHEKELLSPRPTESRHHGLGVVTLAACTLSHPAVVEAQIQSTLC